MPGKFERFTVRARRLLSLAQSEAKRLQHGTIEPEHLLLALLRLDQGAAAGLFRKLDIDIQGLREDLWAAVPPSAEPPGEPITLSSRTQKAVAAAVHESDRREDHRIGALHLLLGLLQEGEGAAYELLTARGVTLADVRAQTSAQAAPGQQSLKGQVQTVLESLSEQEQRVLRLRFGLEGDQPHSVEQVAQDLGITPEQVRQIEAKALRLLG